LMGQRPPSMVGCTEVMTTRDQDFGRSDVRVEAAAEED